MTTTLFFPRARRFQIFDGTGKNSSSNYRTGTCPNRTRVQLHKTQKAPNDKQGKTPYQARGPRLIPARPAKYKSVRVRSYLCDILAKYEHILYLCYLCSLYSTVWLATRDGAVEWTDRVRLMISFLHIVLLNGACRFLYFLAFIYLVVCTCVLFILVSHSSDFRSIVLLSWCTIGSLIHC